MDDSGIYKNVENKSGPWYHLWKENINAIRAMVELQYVGDTVKSTSHSSNLKASEITTPTAKPKWAIITSDVGEYFSVKATVAIDKTGSLAGTQTPVDIAINKIEKVEWVEVAHPETRDFGPGTLPVRLAKLESHDGGYRTFPEKTSPTSRVYYRAEVKVELSISMPAYMWAMVYLDWFDPNNKYRTTTPTTYEAWKRDNYGGMGPSQPQIN